MESINFLLGQLRVADECRQIGRRYDELIELAQLKGETERVNHLKKVRAVAIQIARHAEDGALKDDQEPTTSERT